VSGDESLKMVLRSKISKMDSMPSSVRMDGLKLYISELEGGHERYHDTKTCKWL
jgi:hypothetical protein